MCIVVTIAERFPEGLVGVAPPATRERAHFSASSPAFGVATIFLFNFSHSDSCEAIVQVLICIFQMANDIEHLFWCLLAICISSSVKYLSFPLF